MRPIDEVRAEVFSLRPEIEARHPIQIGSVHRAAVREPSSEEDRIRVGCTSRPGLSLFGLGAVQDVLRDALGVPVDLILRDETRSHADNGEQADRLEVGLVSSWRFEDMRDFASRALRLAAGLPGADEAEAEAIVFAVRYCLMALGEAASRFPNAGHGHFPSIAWDRVIGLRDQLAHGYGGASNAVVLATVRDDLPGILAALNELLAP